MPKGTSARSLKLMRERGYLAEVVEHWVQWGDKRDLKPGEKGGIRRDLFGFGDVFAFDHESAIIVQCTSKTNLAARITKAKAIPAFAKWMHPDRWVEFHGWFLRQRNLVKRHICLCVRLHLDERGVLCRTEREWS